MPKMPSMPLTELVGTTTAAKDLHVTAETVRRWARSGRLRHTVTPSGRMLFDRTDLADAYTIVEPTERVSA